MVKVRFPFRLFFLLFALVAALIVGGAWYIGNERIAGELDVIRTKEIGNVIMGVRRLDDDLSVPLRQLRELANTDAVRRAAAGGGQASFAGLEAEFRTLLAYNGTYDKARWIDADGMERVRVNNVAGRLAGVPPEGLQSRVDSYYFREARSLAAGQVFVSALDLNVENGRVEVPHKPVLRLATPARDGQGRVRGVLVLNVDAGKLLDAFTESFMDARDHAMLLNSEGHWLVSPNPGEAWGFMFQRRDTLAARHPEAWRAISAIPSGQTEVAGDGGLWTWSTAYPLKVTDSSVVEVPHWLVVSHLPASRLALIREEAWATVGSGAAVLLLLFGALTAWLAHALVGRTRAKVEAAQAQTAAEAANRLYEAQKRFRLVVEANATGLLVVDDKGRIEMTNPALDRMFGYEQGELIGQTMEILLPESERGRHEGHRNAYMRAPEARPMGAGRDLHGLRKDGSVVAVEISLSSFMENGRRYVDAVVADISERKAFEERLQRSEAHMRRLLDTHPDGLLVADAGGRISLVNPALEALFGYGAGELAGRSLADLVPEAGPLLAATLGGAGAGQPSVGLPEREHHLQGRRRDGRPFPVEMSLSAFHEDGESHVLVTFVDRGERLAA